MKLLGLIGGMSWESTAVYYRVLNERVARRLGGLHSARCLLYSFDFAEIEDLQRAGDWSRLESLLVEAARALDSGGADGLLICTNTMHKVAPAIEQAVQLPLLHIADATAARIRTAGLRKVGLLGTRFTMEEDFYRSRLAAAGDLDVRVPEQADRRIVDELIFGELCRGQFTDEVRAKFRAVIANLATHGCEGVILGCTEIGLAVQSADSPIPIFDTTIIHAETAADWAAG